MTTDPTATLDAEPPDVEPPEPTPAAIRPDRSRPLPPLRGDTAAALPEPAQTVLRLILGSSTAWATELPVGRRGRGGRPGRPDGGRLAGQLAESRRLARRPLDARPDGPGGPRRRTG